MAEKTTFFIRVYCPELRAMIVPGEWTDCPYFGGQKLDLSDTEDALKQIFRCHVQCDCKVLYQYYENGRLVEKAAESVEDQESLRRILSLAAKSSGKKVPSKKKVLLVDDDADFLEMHSAVLENRGYSVVTARSSQEGLEKLEGQRPDVVVLDVMMERFDSGFIASKKIKDKHPEIRVILLTSIGSQTGLEFSSNADILKETGADILLDKPVSPKVFIEAIDKLTGPSKDR
jgi:two-component system alkaline phosphatase synthesis response regulator PhoP